MRNTCPSEAITMITNFENNTKTLKIIMKVSKNTPKTMQIHKNKFYKPIEIL
jgi:formate hydrogenlyase subunit 6/NADH:ubiquinone oxidoreductase subunit I